MNELIQAACRQSIPYASAAEAHAEKDASALALDPSLIHEITYRHGVRPSNDLLIDGRMPTGSEVRTLLSVLARSYEEKNKPPLNPVEINLHYSGNLIARPDFALRDPAFRGFLAQYIRMLGIRGDTAFDWIAAMIYGGHDGDLFTLNDDWLDPDNLRPTQIWDLRFLKNSKMMTNWRVKRFPGHPWLEIRFEMREFFGEEVRGILDKFLRFAETLPTKRANVHLLGQMMFIDLACRIHAGAILQEAIRVAGEAANAA